MAAACSGRQSLSAFSPADRFCLPVSIVGNIGVALLGIAVAKAGAPRWAAALIVIGGLGYGPGFATSSKTLVLISFALMFAGLVPAVRTLAARSRPSLAVQPADSAAIA